MNMSVRRRMLESAVSFASEPLYIYQSGDKSFKNCTHRAEKYKNLIGAEENAINIYFEDKYFGFTPSSHQNADDLSVYYLYLDVTRYKKIVVKALRITSGDIDKSVEPRVGVFDSDGLKCSVFTDENSLEVTKHDIFGVSEPEELAFDVKEMKGTKILAFSEENYRGGAYFEIRME